MMKKEKKLRRISSKEEILWETEDLGNILLSTSRNGSVIDDAVTIYSAATTRVPVASSFAAHRKPLWKATTPVLSAGAVIESPDFL